MDARKRNCLECKRLIRNRQHMLKCCACQETAHRKCLPIIPDKSFEDIQNFWKCSTCVPTDYPDQLRIAPYDYGLRRARKRLELTKFINDSRTRENPMQQNNLVISHVLEFLGVEDLKNCSLVSREWSRNAKLALRKSAKIVIPNKYTWETVMLLEEIHAKHRNINYASWLSNFSNVFYDSMLNVPYSAFKIDGGSMNWDVNTLTKFFKSQEATMKELEFDSIVLVDENNEKVTNFTLPWISSAMKQPRAKYFTKLLVGVTSHRAVDERRSAMIVPWKDVVYIKDVALLECRIEIADAGLEKLLPTKFCLQRTQFCVNGSEVNGIRINDLVDFSNSREVTLTQALNHRITLDLSSDETSVDLEMLSLNYINAINWKFSRWTINKLILAKVSFTEKTDMTILELDFRGKTLDLSCLPQSIEFLSIYHVGTESTVICPQRIVLENLRYLYLHIRTQEAASAISHLTSCPNLVAIHLNGEGGYQLRTLEMKLDWIPRSVDYLRLSFLPVKWKVTKKKLVLKRLVLFGYHIREVKTICIPKIKAEDVVWHRKNPVHTEEFTEEFIFEMNRRFNSKCWNRLFIGPFCKHPENMPRKIFSYIGSRRFQKFGYKYYEIRKQDGNEISRDTFLDLRRIKLECSTMTY